MAMAMAINGTYRNALITGTDWHALADAASIERDELASWVRDVVTRAPDALADVARQERPWIADLPMSNRLVSDVGSFIRGYAVILQLERLLRRAVLRLFRGSGRETCPYFWL